MNEKHKNTSLLHYDEIDWEEVDRITEIERNLPDVMEFDKEYREKTWSRYGRENAFWYHNYWWGLERSRLMKEREHLKQNENPFSTEGYPTPETCALAFVKARLSRPELHDWLKWQMELFRTSYFDAPTTIEEDEHSKWGLSKEKYWRYKGVNLMYTGYLYHRYAPYLLNFHYRSNIPRMVESALGLFFCSNDLSIADDRAQFFEAMRSVRNPGPVIQAYLNSVQEGVAENAEA